jgi:hypothetical protein
MMIKMQIIMDEEKILKEKKYSLPKIYEALDDYFVRQLHIMKGEDGFYVGSGAKGDFGNFGLAMWTLGKKDWFMDNVRTWLYFNSEDSDDPKDFIVEDFKDFCIEKYRKTA